jgi:hypothetical protein
MNKKEIQEVRELITELKQLTKSKVVLKEERDLSTTHKLKLYIEQLMRHFKIKQLIHVRVARTFIVVMNKNPDFNQDTFKPVINHILRTKDFKLGKNRRIDGQSYSSIVDQKTKLSILFPNEMNTLHKRK